MDAHGDLKSLRLAGATVGVKDIIDTADMPTDNGTVLDAGRPPSADATVARFLREAGAVIMGKTVTTELGVSAREPLAKARFAFVRTPAWAFAEDSTIKAFEDFAAALELACEELVLPAQFDCAIELHRTIAEIALNLGRYYDRGKGRLSAVAREAVSAVDYAGTLRKRERLYCQLEALVAPYDAVPTPSSTGPAPLGLHTTDNPALCTLWTFLGVPAMNLPLLTVNGLPLGVQLTGLRFQEYKLFRCRSELVPGPCLEN